jgi:maltose O-acetyltransferase
MDPRRDRVIRAACLAFYYTIGIRLPPRPIPGYRFGYAVRRWLVGRIAETCGTDVLVQEGCHIGRGVGVRVGDRTLLGHNAWIDQYVSLGKDVVMGPDVVIMTHHLAFEDPSVPVNQQGLIEPKPVTVGDNVWIGMRAMILPGVSVGSNAVIGAGSVVRRSVPAGAIVAGNPARVLRFRDAATENGSFDPEEDPPI